MSFVAQPLVCLLLTVIAGNALKLKLVSFVEQKSLENLTLKANLKKNTTAKERKRAKGGMIRALTGSTKKMFRLEIPPGREMIRIVVR